MDGSHARAGFLLNFARDGVFQAFARRDESRDGGVAPLDPGGLAPQQDFVAAAGTDDDSGIGAGEVGLLALWIRARAQMPALAALRGTAARAAEAMLRVPEGHRPGVGEDPAIEPAQQRLTRRKSWNSPSAVNTAGDSPIADKSKVA